MIVFKKENKKRYRVQFSLTKKLNDRYRECCEMANKFNLSINILDEFRYWFEETLYKIEYELRDYQCDYDEINHSSMANARVNG